MTGGTAVERLLMSSALRCESLCLVLVAGRAKTLGNVAACVQLDILRLVRQVAQQAIRLDHRFFMPLVTIKTNPKLFMLDMTAGAILFAVAARLSSELFCHIAMASHTDRSVWLYRLQVKLQRLMWFMALLTISHRVVRVLTRCVAVKAGFREPCPLLWVLGMALGAG
jgi:hypothetical protein